MQNLLELIENLQLPKELLVALIAAIPLLELRASIPVAMLAGIPLLTVLFWSVLGSWVPAFFVVFLLEHIEPLLRRINFLNVFIDKVYAKTRAKSEQIQKWEFWGLVLFIGIPLPGTGVWTGSLAGYLLGLNKFKIIFASLLGTFIAGILVISLFVFGVLIYHYALAALLGLALLVCLYGLYRRFRH